MEVECKEQKDGSLIIEWEGTDDEEAVFFRKGLQAIVDDSEYKGKIVAVNPSGMSLEGMKTVEMGTEEYKAIASLGMSTALTKHAREEIEKDTNSHK
jgi:hypothetical protein